MAKINKIFKIDVGLIPSFICIVVSGIGIHISSERGIHEAWHNWAVGHVLFCLVFLLLMYYHISQHRGWYKSLIKTRMKGRGITVVLSVLFLLEALSGIILLVFIDGDGSSWGHFHWITGILFSGFGVGHFVKRFSRLKKGLKLAK